MYGNPEWWLVVDGRLYLFGKPIGAGLMSKDPATMKEAADKNWPRVSKNSRPAEAGLHARRGRATVAELTSLPLSGLPQIRAVGGILEPRSERVEIKHRQAAAERRGIACGLPHASQPGSGRRRRSIEHDEIG